MLFCETGKFCCSPGKASEVYPLCSLNTVLQREKSANEKNLFGGGEGLDLFTNVPLSTSLTNKRKM
jgi:hypothetical protein